MMKIQPIKTEQDYERALKEIDRLSDAKPNSMDGDLLELWVTLVDAYEAKHHAIPPPDPIEAIKFRMEQAGLSAKDLVPAIGRLNRVYEILSRKRPLTLSMIWKLHQKLGIPAECLIQPPRAA